MFKALKPALVAAFVCLANLSFAWNDVGHQLVADLAYRRLPVKMRQKAVALLKQLPTYERDIASRMPANLTPEQQDEFIFAMCSTWPDIIRSPNHPRNRTDHHAVWHYCDLGIVDPRDPIDWETTVPKFGNIKDPDNAVDAIEHNMEILKGTAPDPEKAIALCWILHIIGDIHQPLHCATMYSKALPQGDYGGSGFLLADTDNTSRTEKLHSIWDGMLGSRQSFAEILKMRDILEGCPCYNRQYFASELRKKTYLSWIREGHAICKREVYLLGSKEPLKGINYKQRDAGVKAPELPKNYLKRGDLVASRQASVASFRLADTLRTVLK
ncbi:MAG: S1/P1 nuclease [Candidatus Sumerlaeaceae bacterium]|nr:S1/P1 nuclease [Candidatus Sumerlaeaceae bacterium]